MRCPLSLLCTNSTATWYYMCTSDLRFVSLQLLHIALNIASPFLCVRTFSPGFGNCRCFPKYYPISYSALFCCSFSQLSPRFTLLYVIFSVHSCFCTKRLFIIALFFDAPEICHQDALAQLSTLLCLWVFRKFAMHQVALFFSLKSAECLKNIDYYANRWIYHWGWNEITHPKLSNFSKLTTLTYRKIRF
jgi:hypothetical protein